jgi:hypothetical protein
VFLHSEHHQKESKDQMVDICLGDPSVVSSPLESDPTVIVEEEEDESSAAVVDDDDGSNRRSKLE